jgi:hypothetical protein
MLHEAVLGDLGAGLHTQDNHGGPITHPQVTYAAFSRPAGVSPVARTAVLDRPVH